MFTYNGRELEIENVEGTDQDDIYVTGAYWVDNGLSLTEYELDRFMQDCAEEIYEYWFQGKIGLSEYLFEGDR